ncbi:MAG: hypothetical protein ACOCRK_02545 [bacterium]
MIKIGLDIDNTINASDISKQFFSIFSILFNNNAKIYIITNREQTEEEYANIKKELYDIGISYDEIIITPDKKKAIEDNNIQILFEDTDEYFQGIGDDVLVFKIREHGNYDFNDYKWVYSNKTGKNIYEKGK